MYLLTNVLQDLVSKESWQYLLDMQRILFVWRQMFQALHAFWLKNTTAVVGYVLEALAIDWDVTHICSNRVY
jgi:hypothetical protein